MRYEEKLIVDFLKPMPGAFFTVTEIGRKAGTRKMFEDNPSWPRAYLGVLVEQGFLASNPLGQYCFKVESEKQKKRFVAGCHLVPISAVEAAKRTGVGKPKSGEPPAKAA
jgi:hypothetical protein